MDFSSIVSGIGSAGSSASLVGGALQSINDIGGLDLLGYNYNADKRQLKQTQKLQDILIAGNEALANYGMGLQQEMWDYTNYENQVKHLRDAGLNPGLLYSKGGGGGTTGTISAGQVSGGQAANAAQTRQAEMQATGMGLQFQMMQAQVEAAKAQANAANAAADKDRASIPQIQETTSLLKLQGLTEQQKALSLQNDNEFKTIQNEIARETKGTEIARRIAELENVIGQGKLIGAQTSQAKTAADVNVARLDEIGADVALKYNVIWKNKQEAAQGWEQLKIAARDVWVKEYGINYNALVNQRGQDINATVEEWKTNVNTYTQKLINNQNIQMKMRELGFNITKMANDDAMALMKLVTMAGILRKHPAAKAALRRLD